MFLFHTRKNVTLIYGCSSGNSQAPYWLTYLKNPKYVYLEYNIAYSDNMTSFIPAYEMMTLLQEPL